MLLQALKLPAGSSWPLPCERLTAFTHAAGLDRAKKNVRKFKLVANSKEVMEPPQAPYDAKRWGMKDSASMTSTSYRSPPAGAYRSSARPTSGGRHNQPQAQRVSGTTFCLVVPHSSCTGLVYVRSHVEIICPSFVERTVSAGVLS